MNTSIFEASTQYIKGLMANPATTVPCNLPESVIDGMARANHEAWCAGKRADGYVYGETTDDAAKTHCLLIDFDELPESVKADNVGNAKQSISLIVSVGCTISDGPDAIPATEEQIAAKVDLIVEALHDDWAASKARKGYTYAETRNDDPEKGPLTHRDMLPFALLMELHPEDADYDRQTALGAIAAVQNAGYTISV